MHTLRWVVIAVLSLLLAGSSLQIAMGQTPQATASALTNGDVLKMLRAGLSQAVVIAKINSSICDFDTSPAALSDLKEANVPDSVILAMVQAPLSENSGRLAKPTAPTVDQILEKYLAALGGTNSIKKLTSTVLKASLDYQGKSGTGTYYAKTPNKTADVLDFPGSGEIRHGFDGVVGWVENSKSGVRELAGQELSVTSRLADFYGALKLNTTYPKLTYIGTTDVAGLSAYLIEGDAGDGSLRRMYFDSNTGLIVRNDSELDTPQGRKTFTWYYDDFRVVDGVPVPFVRRELTGNESLTVKVTEVEHNVPIDDSIFAKPASTAMSKSAIPASSVRALGYRVVPQEQTTYIQSGQNSSHTSCYGQGTWFSSGSFGNLNMNTDCNTTYTSPTEIPITWQFADVYNVVETDTYRYVIGCRANWRWSNCVPLIPGDTFAVEVQGGTMVVSAVKNGKKQVRIKYNILQVVPKA